MTTALSEREPLTVTPDQLELVKRTVANGATDAELKLYLYDCQRQGVHPLDRLLHFTKRGGKYTPVTSIDLMRIRAAETSEYAGSDDAEFDPAPHAGTGNGMPQWARVTVWRLVQGTRCAFTATARWSEYYPGDAAGTMWRKMPHTMLAKCAEALALRKGFPRQLAGLYAREEMDQADAGPKTEPARLISAFVKHDEQVDAAPVIDTESGAELPQPPDGYHYITGYTVQGEWHEAQVLRWDDACGSLKVSTKRPAIGNLLARASNESIPAQVNVTIKRNTKGEAYVNGVTLLKDVNAAIDHEIVAAEHEAF